MNIDFIIGSLFGFGTFMLTLIVMNWLTQENASSFKQLFDKIDEQSKELKKK